MRLQCRFPQPRLLFGLTIASLFLSFLAVRYFNRSERSDDDFNVYYCAARVVAGTPHANLYEGDAERNAQTLNADAASPIAQQAHAVGLGEVQEYVYPPLLADLMVPMARLHLEQASALWRVCNLAALLLALILLARPLRISLISFEFAVLTMGAYCMQPVHEALSFGQITLILLALWAVGVCAYMDGRVLLSAFALALATALKVTPVLVIPLFLIWRERRWMLGYLGSLTGLFALMWGWNGVQSLGQFWATISSMGGGFPAFNNKCIASLVAWIFQGHLLSYQGAADSLALHLPWLNWMTKAVCGVFYLVCLVLVFRARRSDPVGRATALALISLVTLCVSPVSWRHAYTIAIIPFALCWSDALRRKRSKTHLLLLTLCTFFNGTVFCDHLTNAPLPEAVRILLAGSGVISTILFSINALYEMGDPGFEGLGVGTELSVDASRKPAMTLESAG
ncbi:MAG: glycosyltransferase family 87 protein [Terracidiphilus sp.]